MGGDWIGSEGFYLQCEEGFQCTIHPSVWYGGSKEVIRRFHQIYLKMKNASFINRNGHNYKYYFFMKKSRLVKIETISRKLMLQN